MNVFDSADFDHHEAGRVLRRQEDGAEGDHRHPFHRAGPGLRRHAHVSLRDGRRRADRRAAPVARHELQERDRRPAARRRQGRHHRQSRDRQDARRSFAAYADAVNALGGRYVTAMDVGMLPPDMPVIARGTKFIAGYDQPGKTGGDSGPATALGVFVGLKAAVKHRLGVDTTKGLARRDPGPGQGRHGRGQAPARRRRQADRRRHQHGRGAARPSRRSARVGRDAGPDRHRRMRRALAQRARRDPERPDDPGAACARSSPAAPTTSSRATTTARC